MAIEQDGRSCLLIDCGLMFPDADMHGIDLVLPDFTWLRENADRDRRLSSPPTVTRTTSARCSTCCASCSFPIYGSAVTLGLARNRIEEAGLLGRTELIAVATASGARSGRSTSSSSRSPTRVPHAHAIAVHTPQGVILHSGDFKLDLTPVDGRRTDLARIGAIASTEGIRLLLADSTNAEEHGHAPSETQRRRACCAQLFARARAAGGSSRPASPATSTASSRSPTPPIAGGPRRRHARAEHEEERADGPRPRRAARSPTSRSSTSRTSTTTRPARCA